jgi:hypothetical protein
VYCKFAYYDLDVDGTVTATLMFLKSDAIPSNYIPYGYYYDYPYKILDLKGWYGKKCTSFGDSNTANYRWQEFVANYLCTEAWINCGIGGTSMAGSSDVAMWQDDRIETIPSDTEFLSIMAGTNDSAGNVDIGTIAIDNADTSTFVGAYNTCLKKIYERCGDEIEIMLITPVPCFVESYNLAHLDELSKAIVNIGRIWHIPVCDMYSSIGLNTENYSAYYSADGIHINYEGGKRFAQRLIGSMKTMTTWE